MNDKGFTLIEIIAIVLILATIFFVSFPTLINITKQNEEKKYNNMVTDLCTAGKTYMYSNMDKFENLSIVGTEYLININELIEYGSVNKNLVNPKSKNTVERDILKYIVKEDFSLECEYVKGE